MMFGEEEQTTQELKLEQAEREEIERRLEASAELPREALQHERRRDKAAYLRQKLAERELTGIRLSCQLLCEGDMTVRAISRLEGSGRAEAGPAPAPEITPEPVWTSVDA